MIIRLFYLFFGMFLGGIAISAVAQAGLGTSPISTLPFVLSHLTEYSFGTMTFAVNVVFVFMQWALLRSHFKFYNLLQIPLVFLSSAAAWIWGCGSSLIFRCPTISFNWWSVFRVMW